MAIFQKYRVLTATAVAIIAALGLAVSLSSLELHPGRSLPLGALLDSLNQMGSPFTGGGQLPFDPIRIVAVLLWIVLIIGAIAFIVSPQLRREFIKRSLIYLAWALIIYGLIRVIQPALTMPDELTDSAELGRLEQGDAIDEPLPVPPEFVVDPPQWLVFGVTIILIVAPLFIGWVLWTRLSWLRQKSFPEEAELAELVQSAQNALDQIELGNDVHNTVIGCYRDMEQILARRRNLIRERGMTPREFEQHLARSGLRTEDIRRLIQLFERVRYGAQVLTHREQAEAVTALDGIVRSYGRPA
jgi:hypothetical protein